MTRVIHITRRTLAWCLGLVLGGVLIFWLLLRITTLTYLRWQLSAASSTLLGTLSAFAALFIGTQIICYFLRLKHNFTMGLMVLSMLYVFYSLCYVSLGNVKASNLRDDYGSLHPSLRLALGTFFMFDPEGILTDLSREPEDYQKMGLKSLRRSLHYVQDDGYVHAVDLRTRERSERSNHWMTLYFRAIGLNTKRHVGTADHLHVSLPVASEGDAQGY